MSWGNSPVVRATILLVDAVLLVLFLTMHFSKDENRAGWHGISSYSFNDRKTANTPSEYMTSHLVGKTYDEAREWLYKTMYPVQSMTQLNSEYGNGRTFWDKGYTELVSCSGTGAAPCLFLWNGKGDKDRDYYFVMTEGEQDDLGKAKIVNVSGISYDDLVNLYKLKDMQVLPH